MPLRRRIHRLLSRMIYNDGLALVPSNIAGPWAERQFIRRLLKRLNVDCVIDVGANEGQYASDLRLIGFKGTILSFEPDPATFSKLESISARDSRWHAFNFALGEVPTVAELNIMKRSVFNSFRRPSTSDTEYFASENQIVETIPVQVERLDTVLPDLRSRFGFERPFLKSDTQGFDVDVFRGAAGVHRELFGIQSELPIKHLYADSLPWTDAIREYASSGFELAGIFAVNPTEPILIECDCFFERSA